jgi:nitrile hydratase subunit beta
MNGAHDLGGMMGFGSVEPEPNEPVFHAEWEKRVLGIGIACDVLGEWNIDLIRQDRESFHPTQYLSWNYYETRIRAHMKMLARHGLVMPEEVAAGRALRPARPTKQAPLKSFDTARLLATGTPYYRPLDRAPRFAIGTKVCTRNINPAGHTRLPRYARAKFGIVEHCRGSFVFPDTNAQGKGEEDPQWIYSVVFTGTELWGDGADPTLTVAIDCWEPYLEPA